MGSSARTDEGAVPDTMAVPSAVCRTERRFRTNDHVGVNNAKDRRMVVAKWVAIIGNDAGLSKACYNTSKGYLVDCNALHHSFVPFC